MKNILLNVFFLSLVSCSFFKSDYDEIMGPIKKIKEEEKKLGKPNPIYDGVREPDFPDEVENNKTFDGVDSNHDGIRDDIEIWINRTSEDKEVRIAMREFLAATIREYKYGAENGDEKILLNLTYLYFTTALCVRLVKRPYGVGKMYSKEFTEVIDILLINSAIRQKTLDQYNQYDYKTADTKPVGREYVNYCSLKHDQAYLKKLMERYR